MNRRTVLKGGAVLATASHTAIQEASAVATTPESDHAKLKRLAWEISDLLNGLDPSYDYVSIQPSGVGKSAVLFGWNIEQEIVKRQDDPLLETIREYSAGIQEFNRLAKSDVTDEDLDRFEEKTFGPALGRLHKWKGAATTRDGAVAALRLAMDDDEGVGRMEAADRMFKAALGYMEGLA
jgi:hypothetical protein